MATALIIEQKAELLYPQILFNRPINKLQMPQVGLIGGSPARLKILDDVYQSLIATRNRVLLAVPQAVAPLVGSIAAATMLLTLKGKADDTQVCDILSESNLLILAPGLDYNSEWHQRLDKIATELAKPLLVTAEMVDLVAASPELLCDGPGLLALSTEQAIKLAGRFRLPVSIQPARGIFNKSDLINLLSAHSNALVVLLDEHQIAVGHFALEQVGLLQDHEHDFLSYRGYIIGLLAAFYAGQSSLDKQFQSLMCALYVLKMAIAQNPKDLGHSIGQIINKVV